MNSTLCHGLKQLNTQKPQTSNEHTLSYDLLAINLLCHFFQFCCWQICTARQIHLNRVHDTTTRKWNNYKKITCAYS